jgi:hypothetical protein
MVKFSSQHYSKIISIVETIKKDKQLTLKADLVKVFTEQFPDTNFSYQQLYSLYNKKQATKKVIYLNI